MARLTRHELKEDELQSTLTKARDVLLDHSREILALVGIVLLVVGTAGALKLYADRQEAQANLALGHALKVFHGFVGNPPAGTQGSKEFTFVTGEQKYSKALEEFSRIAQEHARQKTGWIARYYVGLCQARLGHNAEALKALEEAAKTSDRDISSLARFALAAEKAKAGKVQESIALYKDLAEHPTFVVSRSTALIGLADLYRATKPQEARKIYQQLSSEHAADAAFVAELKSLADTLPQ